MDDAKLWFFYGAMGSSKTANALMVRFNYHERGMKAALLKPKSESRDGKHIVKSRIGIEGDCVYVEDFLDQVDRGKIPEVDAIIIDEAQFLTPKQADELMQIVTELDIPVMAYGLRLNFRLTDGGFEGATRLLQIAHDIDEIKTICECGRKATCNARFLNGKFVADGPDVLIDDGKTEIEYRAICPKCFAKYKKEKYKPAR